jgi:hypothetical protein
MTSDDRGLSERMRQGVAALHDAQLKGAQPLGPDAQGRVIAQLTAEAARLPAQRRRQRIARASIGIGVLAAAAAAVLLLRPNPKNLQPTAAIRTAPSASDVPACGLPVFSAGQAFEALADESQSLRLGRYGELISGAAAEVQIESASPCELRVRLARGELAGDLHSLRPARLVVRTAQGDVLVTGTRFSVRSGDDFEVLLASGVVDVVFGDHSSVRLSPGTRLHKPGPTQRAETRALSVEDKRRLSYILREERTNLPEVTLRNDAGPSTHAPAKPVLRAASTNAQSVLDVAEAARRAGRYAEARDAYRTVSQRADDSAEIALLRWVRLELDVTDPAAALRVLTLHSRRFARGRLGAEAGWLEVQVYQALQRPERALAAARKLEAQHPGTPQATAAARLLGGR